MRGTQHTHEFLYLGERERTENKSDTNTHEKYDHASINKSATRERTVQFVSRTHHKTGKHFAGCRKTAQSQTIRFKCWIGIYRFPERCGVCLCVQFVIIPWMFRGGNNDVAIFCSFRGKKLVSSGCDVCRCKVVDRMRCRLRWKRNIRNMNGIEQGCQIVWMFRWRKVLSTF